MNKGEWAIQCGKHIEPTSATSHPGNFNKKYHYHDKNEYECVYCEYNSLKEKLSQYESGHKGACSTCEVVGELNVELEKRLEEAMIAIRKVEKNLQSFQKNKPITILIFEVISYVRHWLTQNNQTKEKE